jgi:hypothetical protein
MAEKTRDSELKTSFFEVLSLEISLVVLVLTKQSTSGL